MMTIDQTPLPQRVVHYYSQLSAAAKDLNSISDELGKSITDIDIALRKLNLGVAVWVPIRKDEGLPQESWFWSEDIGYSKIGSNWGISLRKVSGDHQYPEQDNEELWLFNDAPRALRISAIDRIPDLLEKLSKETVKTTENIRARLSEAQAVAQAVKGAANPVRVPLRIPLSSPKNPETALPPSPGGSSVDSIREAIISALTAAGHHSAAQLLGGGEWKVDGASVRVITPGMGKKMLALTVNAQAEYVIRKELRRLGAPPRFLVSGGETAVSAADAASSNVPEVEK